MRQILSSAMLAHQSKWSSSFVVLIVVDGIGYLDFIGLFLIDGVGLRDVLGNSLRDGNGNGFSHVLGDDPDNGSLNNADTRSNDGHINIGGGWAWNVGMVASIVFLIRTAETTDGAVGGVRAVAVACTVACGSETVVVNCNWLAIGVDSVIVAGVLSKVFRLVAISVAVAIAIVTITIAVAIAVVTITVAVAIAVVTITVAVAIAIVTIAVAVTKIVSVAAVAATATIAATVGECGASKDRSESKSLEHSFVFIFISAMKLI